MTDNGLAAFYRRYNACCNEHRFEDLGEFVARDVAINDAEHGLDVYMENLRSVVRTFPDQRWEVRHLVVDEPWVAVHLTDTGTHRGPYLGVAPTGRFVTTQEFALYRIEAGRIAAVWGTVDHAHLLEQIR